MNKSMGCERILVRGVFTIRPEPGHAASDEAGVSKPHTLLCQPMKAESAGSGGPAVRPVVQKSVHSVQPAAGKSCLHPAPWNGPVRRWRRAGESEDVCYASPLTELRSIWAICKSATKSESTCDCVRASMQVNSPSGSGPQSQLNLGGPPSGTGGSRNWLHTSDVGKGGSVRLAHAASDESFTSWVTTASWSGCIR